MDDNAPELGGTLPNPSAETGLEQRLLAQMEELKDAPDLDLQIWPAPVLSMLCDPVTEFDESLERLINSMAKVMYAHGGIGIAAPQVGVSKRVCIIDLGSGREVLVNPEVTWRGATTDAQREGCLSMPGLSKQIERPVAVHVKAQNRFGAEIEIQAGGQRARVLQHEIDHLDGLMFIDRLSEGARKLALKKWAKIQRQIARRGRVGGAPKGPRRAKRGKGRKR